MAKSSIPFSQKAYVALGHAERLAERLKHDVVTPEHILFGLLQTPDGHANLILESLRADTDTLRQRLEDSLQWPSRRPLVAQPAGAHTSDYLSGETQALLTDAALEAQRLGLAVIDTRLLLVSLLRTPRLLAADLLHQQGITEAAVLAQPILSREVPAIQSMAIPASATTSFSWSVVKVSPVFLIIVLVTVVSGYLTYTRLVSPGLSVFLFVTGGWLVSLCLHEFGHALVAFWGGDQSVVGKGYLTLNPFKYTHTLFSLVLPILFMVMGGIGLPGGAVYINRAAIRSKRLESLMSAAGPLATAACSLLVLTPFLFRATRWTAHMEFWAGLALLAYLQLTALIFNLMPIPGLDGFGILAPFLPLRLLQAAYRLGQFTYLIIFLLFFNDTPIRRGFMLTLSFVTQLFSLDLSLVSLGFSFYRFWSQ
jgi:Zn-dependent protease